METSNHSQLPAYAVERFHIDEPGGSYDMLKVVCERTGCKMEFWIKPTWGIIRPVEGREEDPPALPVGRNCPHCGRVSAIPVKYQIKWGSHTTSKNILPQAPPGRNVVRRRKGLATSSKNG